VESVHVDMYNLSLSHSLGIAEQTYYIFSNNHHSLDDRQDNHNKKSFHPSIGKKQRLTQVTYIILLSIPKIHLFSCLNKTLSVFL
ncbi:hypothetical protein, partial [Bacteroides acidifaciens]|uniref:hypothetical protein n=1 Tax=Bacteroides acidifaciens TaxID=85831 RepID=UPI003013559D